MFNYYVSDGKGFVNHSELVLTVRHTTASFNRPQNPYPFRLECGQVSLEVVIDKFLHQSCKHVDIPKLRQEKGVIWIEAKMRNGFI